MGFLLQFSPGHLVLQQFLLGLNQGLVGELVEGGAFNTMLLVDLGEFLLQVLNFLEPLVDHFLLKICN